MSHESAIDGSQVSRDMESYISDDLVAPLSSGIAFDAPERDVELAALNAELWESGTTHIRIISQPCSERLLVFFKQYLCLYHLS